jgi:hypothetical protein
MALTDQQKATIKADILARPEFAGAPLTVDGSAPIADFYNANVSPGFYVWKSVVTEKEIFDNGLDWTLIDNLTVGKDRVWQWLFKDGKADPSKPNVRAGIEEVWKGTAAMLAQRAIVLGHCKRLASNVERLLASGTGSEAVPANIGFEGTVSPVDIYYIRSI